VSVKDRKRLIEFWIESSDKDFKTMSNLFKSKDYSWALFVGHLVVEKLLKAHYIKAIDQHHPFTHNLLSIASKANLELSDKHKEILDTITTFNLNTRYDNEKQLFYLKSNRKFTENWIKEIKLMRKWIKEKL
jgi:HEPN domain-containing protein